MNNKKQIEEITDEDLAVIWGRIGGTPHLFEYGKDELRHVLITGECVMEGEIGGKPYENPITLQLDYYTMAAITDTLRARGFETITYVD